MHRLPWTGAALAALAVTAGCGKQDDYANKPRPAASIVVTASIGKDRVSVSPRRFGAGPVDLIITNQTSSAQQVTFASSGSAAGFSQQTGPINPRDTATIKADVPRGGAVIRVESETIRPATIRVGADRPSAQNDLLQP